MSRKGTVSVAAAASAANKLCADLRLPLPRPQRLCKGESFRAFCMHTSLHGWHYMVDRSVRSPVNLQRTMWGAILLLAVVTAFTFLYNNTWDFLNSNVVTTVDTMTAPLSEVFFPSVVVCNINQVRDSYFDTVWDDAPRKVIPQEDIGGTHQLCKDMFVYSKWNGSTTFSHLQLRERTDYGMCCWFTPQFNFTEILRQSELKGLKEPDWGHWFMKVDKGAKTGKDNGYTLLLDIESFDYKFFSEGSEGLKVALVHHLDMPIVRQIGFHISPGTENQIAVTPTLISTSDDAMVRFSPDRRDCYSEGEISLQYLPKSHGYRYEMSNCLFEAALEKILETCRCFPGLTTATGSESKCMGKDDLVCVNNLMNMMGDFDTVVYKGKKEKCRSNCEDQMNSVFVTSSSYPNKAVFTQRPEFCYTVLRILAKCETPKRRPLSSSIPGLCAEVDEWRPELSRCESEEWWEVKRHVASCTTIGGNRSCAIEDLVWRYARRNLAVLNIFIKDPYARRYLREVKTTTTKFIANSGCILGFCMGFSLISGAEVVFHIVAGLFSKKRLVGDGLRLKERCKRRS